MTTIFSEALWPGLSAWVALYTCDYFLTTYCARLYVTRVREKIEFEGSFELTPYFQKDIDSGRRFSPRFLLSLCVSVAWLSIIWILTRQPPEWPQAYAFVLGMMLLAELAIHVRHIRNLLLFRSGFGPDGVQGHIQYPRHLVLRMSAAELLAFSALFAIAFAVAGSPFLLGGAAMCAGIALKHRRLAQRTAQGRHGSRLTTG